VRQLSSLDAQFLALEDARTYGHVSGLAIYDPASAPGGTVTIDDPTTLAARDVDLEIGSCAQARWDGARAGWEIELCPRGRRQV
jgi:hypothetical protein